MHLDFEHATRHPVPLAPLGRSGMWVDSYVFPHAPPSYPQGADVIHPYTGGVIGVCVWTDHVTCSLSVPGGEASSEASGPRVALVAHLDDAYARDLNTGSRCCCCGGV